MRDLAKTLSIRTVFLQLIVLAIIAAAIAGLSWQSPLLEWFALVASILLVIADPLTVRNKGGAKPIAEVAEHGASEQKISTPNKKAQVAPVSKTLVASKA